MKLGAAFEKQPKWLVVAESILMIAIIGVCDYATSWEFSLFVFYGFPVFVASWYAGRKAGFLLAALSSATWYFANLPTHPYETSEGYLWAGINRLFYFAFVAAGAAVMKKQRETVRERLEAITLARSLELEVVRAGEREQIRIGQDLHDGVCQNLAAIDCAIECLKDELEAAGLSQAAIAGKIQTFLKETIVEARNLARGIFPIQVESEGIVSALKDLATKADFLREGSAHFECSEEVTIQNPQVALHLYRIVQEAMSNAVRHGKASHTEVSLFHEGDNVVLRISDDGTGFRSGPDLPLGIGLRTMQYRAQLIGATLSVRSKLGIGTTVQCTLPHPRAVSAPGPATSPVTQPL